MHYVNIDGPRTITSMEDNARKNTWLSTNRRDVSWSGQNQCMQRNIEHVKREDQTKIWNALKTFQHELKGFKFGEPTLYLRLPRIRMSRLCC